MISHNHPRFADPSYLPDQMPVDPMSRPDTYDSTAVSAEEWGLHSITCHECGFTVVKRKGETCCICKSWLVRKGSA